MRTYHFPIGNEGVPVYVPETDRDVDAFKDWFQRANAREAVAYDTETTGLDIYCEGYRLRTAQFGQADQAWVLQVDNDPSMMRHAAWALSHASQLDIHNAPFDWLVSDKHMPGVTLETLAPKTTDTRIQAMLIDPRMAKEGGIGTALKPLSAHYIDPSAPDTQAGLHAEFHKIGKTKDTGWAHIDINNPLYLTYAGGDVILTSRLRRIQAGILRSMGVRPELMEYERELARICAVMQRRGCLIDAEYVEELDARLSGEENVYLREADQWGVTNVNSTDQIACALLRMGVDLTERTESGKLKVDKAILTQLSGLTLQGEEIEGASRNPLAYAVYRAKRAGKWRSAYVGKFRNNRDADGRIHPSINSLQARTARMSITGDLAAQTLPSGDWMIRRAILAEPGESWFSVDFAAVELRVLAALADVRRMKEAITAGKDLHSVTAELIYGPNFTKKQRNKICKPVAFSQVYGGSAETTARQTGAPLDDIRYAMAEYRRIYPEIGRASKRWQREARARGFVTVTATGRHLPLDPNRAYAVTNYQVQSAARDVLGQSLINIEEAGLLPYLRLPIHDETAGSAPTREAQEIVKEIARCMTMSLGGVLIEAEGEVGGRSWGSLYGADV